MSEDSVTGEAAKQRSVGEFDWTSAPSRATRYYTSRVESFKQAVAYGFEDLNGDATGEEGIREWEEEGGREGGSVERAVFSEETSTGPAFFFFAVSIHHPPARGTVRGAPGDVTRGNVDEPTGCEARAGGLHQGKGGAEGSAGGAACVLFWGASTRLGIRPAEPEGGDGGELERVAGYRGLGGSTPRLEIHPLGVLEPEGGGVAGGLRWLITANVWLTRAWGGG
ncbi:hypothetical protein C8J57DRAFT_1468729 [Mycena rebaudengoi]|nr:hypothetical protein C8J57DRAFT_1468729 [Mycena rebaudengoi]